MEYWRRGGGRYKERKIDRELTNEVIIELTYYPGLIDWCCGGFSFSLLSSFRFFVSFTISSCLLLSSMRFKFIFIVQYSIQIYRVKVSSGPSVLLKLIINIAHGSLMYTQYQPIVEKGILRLKNRTKRGNSIERQNHSLLVKNLKSPSEVFSSHFYTPVDFECRPSIPSLIQTVFWRLFC